MVCSQKFSLFGGGGGANTVLLLYFSLGHANTIVAVMTLYFSKQIQNYSLT